MTYVKQNRDEGQEVADMQRAVGFVALELSQLATVSDHVRRQVSRFARPAIVGTLAGRQP
jgi:hypothetical protein